MKEIHFQDLGLMPYKTAWDYQENLFKKVVTHKQQQRELEEKMSNNHYLLFCEHPPVFTLGKSGNNANLLINEQLLQAKGIEFYKINRGGDITFHGPGQLVGYPILDLDEFFTDIHKYMRFLEEVIIRTLADFDLTGMRLKGATGVWLDADNPNKARKICAMGVRASRWVTMHGFAFNINTNLNYYQYIVPCGIIDKQITSLQNELGFKVSYQEVKKKVKQHFAEVFHIKYV